jgi:hypothetical protein
MMALPMLASADDLRGGNQRIRPYYERNWGEPLRDPPEWTRGRGYWDDSGYGVTPPWYRVYQLPDGYYQSYAPAPNWRGDRDGVIDRREAFKNRMQDRRNLLKDRRDVELQRQRDARDRQTRPYQYVR